jgi:hypothetical protein
MASTFLSGYRQEVCQYQFGSALKCQKANQDQLKGVHLMTKDEITRIWRKVSETSVITDEGLKICEAIAAQERFNCVKELTERFYYSAADVLKAGGK